MARTPKEQLWEEWVSRTLLDDITTADSPDPVSMIDDTGPQLDTTDTFDDYRYGRGAGEYLYLLYLLDEPVADAADVVPVYVGETTDVTSRLYTHFKKLREALPTAEWSDDGSWGSFSKYDHIAAVYERAASPLYAWIYPLDGDEIGPYGYPTYRQELEAKLVGLVHSSPRFARVLANRDFVPNRVPHESGQVGPDWVDLAHSVPNEEARQATGGSVVAREGAEKSDLWFEWVDDTICRDIRDPDTVDPIPLFETDDRLDVRLTNRGGLKRSAAIDERIRREGKRCVHPDGVSDGSDGLLYVMYQLDSGGSPPDPTAIVPRYIGKAEAYGKKNELSANFEEIAKDRAATRSFARWGDGDYWHVGELSNTVFGEGSKKHTWANALFQQRSHRLQAQTYLWIRAWDTGAEVGPYGYPAYLAEAEPLLIGLAYDAYPEHLLNHDDAPDDAPVKQRDEQFEPATR